MRSGGCRWLWPLQLFPRLSLLLPPLLLLSLLLASSACGAVTTRPAAWRPLPELPDHQGADHRASVTATGHHSGHPSGQHDQHSQLGHPQHGPAPHSRWPEKVPAYLVNWEHPELRGNGGGAPALTPALSFATLTDGSQETSDIIKAITQYQLVRQLVSSSSAGEQVGGSDVTQGERCACGRADLGVGVGPDHLVDTVKASATVALWVGLAAALSSASSLAPLAAGRRRRSARSLADSACDVTARAVGVRSCVELKQAFDQLVTAYEEVVVDGPADTGERSGRRQARSLSVWSPSSQQARPGSRLGRTVRRMSSQLFELTSSALRPLRTALRRWSALFSTSRSGVAAARPPQARWDQPPAGGAPGGRQQRPSRRLYSAGCDCGGWARQGLLGGRAALAKLALSTSFWIPVLGLVFLLGQNNHGTNTASYSPDDKDTVTHNVDISLTNSPSNTQESTQDNNEDTGGGRAVLDSAL